MKCYQLCKSIIKDIIDYVRDVELAYYDGYFLKLRKVIMSSISVPLVNISIDYRVSDGACAPERMSSGAAAFDLTAYTRTVDLEHKLVTYDSGVAFSIPKGMCGDLMARSNACKKRMFLLNGVGLIDSDFRGTVKAVFKYEDINLIYAVGQRIAQISFRFCPVVTLNEVSELDVTDRDAGSYGSTGL